MKRIISALLVATVAVNAQTVASGVGSNVASTAAGELKEFITAPITANVPQTYVGLQTAMVYPYAISYHIIHIIIASYGGTI